jgi:hypothetical protein
LQIDAPETGVQVRRVIRKRIRRREPGLDMAVDFNADIAVNLGRSEQPGAIDSEATEEKAQPDRPAAEGNAKEREDS